jgi:hypothetical protein
MNTMLKIKCCINRMFTRLWTKLITLKKKNNNFFDFEIDILGVLRLCQEWVCLIWIEGMTVGVFYNTIRYDRTIICIISIIKMCTI